MVEWPDNWGDSRIVCTQSDQSKQPDIDTPNQPPKDMGCCDWIGLIGQCYHVDRASDQGLIVLAMLTAQWY